MRLKVLGCNGGVSPEHKATSFMLGDKVVIDAGTLCNPLTLDEQATIDDVILTSAAADRVADLAQFADNVLGRRKAPVTVHATQATLDTLKKHLFNGSLAQDFTALPSTNSPTLKFKAHAHNKKFQVGDVEFTFVPLKHMLDSSAVLVKLPQGNLVFSGDTGPSTALWDAVNKLSDVRALFVECSLPNSMQKLADLSGHLTPQTMVTELKKLTVSGFPVFAYHLKPATFGETRKELRALKMRELHLARSGDVYEL
jgi:ribonuclease BN (tRNA processing enzyme)